MHALASVLGYKCIACPFDFFSGLRIVRSWRGTPFRGIS